MNRAERLRQTVKWVVYSLLIVNWGYYVFDDWRAAQFTLSESDPLIKWMSAYATSLDELAWFGLLFLFEAETYWLSDEALTKLNRMLLLTVRIGCYGFLAHTLYAYVLAYHEFSTAIDVSNASGVCNFVGQDYSFLRNLAYTPINSNNCDGLALTGNLYQIAGDLVITDGPGLAGEKFLAAIDIGDATTWLAVVIIIELMVIAQEKGISEGPFITTCKYLNIGLYGVLVFDAGVWAWQGHYVYAWDQMLWIGGFAAIEMNLSEWRDEIDEATASP